MKHTVPQRGVTWWVRHSWSKARWRLRRYYGSIYGSIQTATGQWCFGVLRSYTRVRGEDNSGQFSDSLLICPSWISISMLSYSISDKLDLIWDLRSHIWNFLHTDQWFFFLVTRAIVFLFFTLRPPTLKHEIWKKPRCQTPGFFLGPLFPARQKPTGVILWPPNSRLLAIGCTWSRTK